MVSIPPGKYLPAQSFAVGGFSAGIQANNVHLLLYIEVIAAHFHTPDGADTIAVCDGFYLGEMEQGIVVGDGSHLDALFLQEGKDLFQGLGSVGVVGMQV